MQCHHLVAASVPLYLVALTYGVHLRWLWECNYTVWSLWYAVLVTTCFCICQTYVYRAPTKGGPGSNLGDILIKPITIGPICWGIERNSKWRFQRHSLTHMKIRHGRRDMCYSITVSSYLCQFRRLGVSTHFTEKLKPPNINILLIFYI